MSKHKKVSRRKFIVRTLLGGAGVLIGATYFGRHALRRKIADFANTADLFYMGDTDNPNIWFEVLTDNSIIFQCPKVEMGQGTFTGLAQIAADELEVDINQIKVVNAATSTGNIDGMSTGGSTSIAGLWMPLRELAATMREMLRLEAAKKLKVEPSTLKIEKGIFKSGDLALSYGETVAGVTNWEIPDTPELKDISEYKYVGKPQARIDLVEKVKGDPIFGIDVEMPDMLYGAVVRPTKIGAVYQGCDSTAAENMPGVVMVVKEEDFVGVVARTRMEAELAKNAIKADWKVDRNWQSADIESLIKVGQGTPVEIQKVGKAKNILEEEQDIISAEFSSPIGAHAQLEPNGSVAHVHENGATILLSTQVVGFTRKEVAKRLGFKETQVNVQATYLGGGFGRRLHTPNAVQAALMSKAAGKPVKCFFNRKEEFQHDTFRPPTHHILKAKLTDQGSIEALEHHVSSGDVMFGSPLVPEFTHSLLGADVGAWRGGMIQYGKIPHQRAVSWRVKLPFATSWWRSLGLLANTFAIESFMDQLAVRAGEDPVDFRLMHIQDDERGSRLKAVIETAAKHAGWTTQVTDGKAMGFAASTDANTPVAHVAEVSIENGDIVVHKVTCVIDPGMAVNPDQIRAQCEGCVIMGISASLFEKMEVKDGELGPIIYGPYKMALMKHAPKEIDVVILENAEAPGAVGEPPLGPIAAAIANAVFRLNGKRLYDLPLSLT